MPHTAQSALVNKLVPCAWLLSGALELWSSRLRLRINKVSCTFCFVRKCSIWGVICYS